MSKPASTAVILLLRILISIFLIIVIATINIILDDEPTRRDNWCCLINMGLTAAIQNKPSGRQSKNLESHTRPSAIAGCHDDGDIFFVHSPAFWITHISPTWNHFGTVTLTHHHSRDVASFGPFYLSTGFAGRWVGNAGPRHIAIDEANAAWPGYGCGMLSWDVTLHPVRGCLNMS